MLPASASSSRSSRRTCRTSERSERMVIKPAAGPAFLRLSREQQAKRPGPAHGHCDVVYGALSGAVTVRLASADTGGGAVLAGEAPLAGQCTLRHKVVGPRVAQLSDSWLLSPRPLGGEGSGLCARRARAIICAAAVHMSLPCLNNYKHSRFGQATDVHAAKEEGSSSCFVNEVCRVGAKRSMCESRHQCTGHNGGSLV